MIGQRFDGRNQILVRVGLHDVRADAGFDDFSDELIGEMQRENQNFSSGKSLLDATRGLESVEVGHADVHHNDVRPKLFGGGYGLAPGLCLSDNFPAGVRGEQLLQTASNNVMIVSHYNPKRH